jgi:hypothetical protein
MHRKFLVVAGVAVLAGLWWAFRPELLFVDAEVDEQLDVPVAVLATGSFHDGAHETAGTASVLQARDGRKLLRLTDFRTSNGPDVRVLMVRADDAKDNDAVKNAGFVEVAELKGNVGDQTYELPGSFDLASHRAVTIWCNRFSVNFGTAPLSVVRP